jgi:hypothetical protein
MGHLILTAVGGELADIVSLSSDDQTAPGADDIAVAVEAAPINNADPAA